MHVMWVSFQLRGTFSSARLAFLDITTFSVKIEFSIKKRDVEGLFSAPTPKLLEQKDSTIEMLLAADSWNLLEDLCEDQQN